MFKPIAHKLNKVKQNHSTIIRQIETFDENVLNPLVTNHHEGIYGFECVKLGEDMEFYTIAPSDYDDVDGIETLLDYEMVRNSLDQIHCYSVELAYPSFLPIKVDDSPLWDDLFALKRDMFVQFLIYKGQNNEKRNWYDQYEHFIRGNDYPSNSKIGRTLQSKTLTLIDRLSGNEDKRKRVPQIERKLLDDGYRVSFRIMLHGEDVEIIEQEIQEILPQRDYFNELVLFKHKNKEGYIEQYVGRTLNVKYAPILSEIESFSFFMVMDNTNVHSKPSNVRDNKDLKTLHGQVDVYHSPIELLPQNTQLNKEIDQSLGVSIIHSLKKIGVVKNKTIKVLNQFRGSTLQKVITNLPEGIKYSDVEKNLKNIKAIIGNNGLTIEQGDEPETIAFNIPCDDIDTVYLRDIIESDEFKEFCDHAEIPFVLGMDTLGVPLFEDLAKIIHLLIAGSTGSGKSFLLNSLILSMLIVRPSTRLNMYLIDPKKVELQQFDGFPQVVDVITDMKKAGMLLDSLIVEMEKRYELFATNGSRNIAGYNKKTKNTMPYIVVVIDEFADLMIQCPQVEDYVDRLGFKARASGIHLIIATQRPDKDTITGRIKANIESRIALSVSDITNSRIILDQKGAEELLGRGDGLAKLAGRKQELIRFQGAVISLDDEETESICEQLKEAMNGQHLQGIQIVETETPKDKLKRIIQSTGETRIGQLQKEMRIRINDVTDIMKELVDDGFLVQEGRSYKMAEGE
jgi:DNA segregation ATPase FtsK/SpoIIIE, S-DNA-T family